jgi:hypothetical protein
MQWPILFIAFSVCCPVHGQAPAMEYKKGSYLYYGELHFEDNSFLLNEAFTQEKGIMQFISTIYHDNLHDKNFSCTFTHEIPLNHHRHQVSYSLRYNFMQPQATSQDNDGWGDTDIGYAYMLSGKEAWIMVVPQLTIIIPTGDPSRDLGYGGLGGRLALTITKRLSRKLVSHYNASYTIVHKADRYNEISGEKVKAFEKTLHDQDLAGSIIWYPVRKVNIMLEYISSFRSQISTSGTISKIQESVVNPGFRLALDLKTLQIIPGLSVPIAFSNDYQRQTGVFVYLSIESRH